MLPAAFKGKETEEKRLHLNLMHCQYGRQITSHTSSSLFFLNAYQSIQVCALGIERHEFADFLYTLSRTKVVKPRVSTVKFVQEQRVIGGQGSIEPESLLLSHFI